MKSPVEFIGMWGIGDLIMHRAVLREAMRNHTVYLRTHNPVVYTDLIANGLKISQISPDRREPRIKQSRYSGPLEPSPRGGHIVRITYDERSIVQAGSVLAAQFASVRACGVTMPDQPDLRYDPVPEAWRASARSLILGWNTGGKPLMIYRPPVLSRVWLKPTRTPDPDAYADLFNSIRERFFTVSVAHLVPGREWIVGPQADIDVRLEHGELDYETMAGLFAEAKLVFGNMGFAHWLAQATQTPLVAVYGGYEGFAATNAITAPLSPTLAIEPDRPCNCRRHEHDCDKRITLPPARARLLEFTERSIVGKNDPIASISAHDARPRVLIFATTYVRERLTNMILDQWLTLARYYSPQCDILLVDTPPTPTVGSVQPQRISARLLIDPRHGSFERYEPGRGAPRMIHRFPDNLGHLGSSPKFGRDGWGRAFSFGLQAAIDGGYDYVAHIEGDSLFKLPVLPIVEDMARDGTNAASVLVMGPGQCYPRPEVETGLMFFRTAYVRDSKLIERYDWQRHTTNKPSPEDMLYRLLGPENLHLMPWRAWRGDHNPALAANVTSLDWMSHTRDPYLYEAFVGNPMLLAQRSITRPMTMRFHYPPSTSPLPSALSAKGNRELRERREKILQQLGLKA